MSNAASARQRSVDDLLVDHVHALLGPIRAELKQMLARVKAIRTAWGPWLTAAEQKPWRDWAAAYFVPDMTGPITAVADRLDATEATVTQWEEEVATLTPRTAHRFGAGHRLTAYGLLREPAVLLQQLQKVRDQAADVEAKVALHGPLAPARRATEWTPKTHEELHGREFPKAKTEFDPREVD